jgi:two-component system, OmpR family, sensor kinase
MKAPIRVRLTLLYVLVLAAIIAGLIAFVATRLRADLTAELDGTLRDAAAQIAHSYRAEGPSEFHDTSRTVLPSARDEPAGAQVLDPSEHVVLSEGAPPAAVPLVGPDALATVLAGSTVIFSRRLGRPVRHMRGVATPAGWRGRRQVLVVAESLHQVDDAAHRVLLLLLVGGSAALALVGVGGWWIARRALRPVDRMTTRAEAIGTDDLSQRIAVPRVNDELAHLARTLNAMLDRLHDHVQARQRLVADASHELRAPLAAMRAELDVSLRQDERDPNARAALALARDDAVRLARIVDNLLTLARVDEGRLELLKAPHDLHELARRAARAHQPAATARHIQLTIDGDQLVAAVDGDRLGQVLGNLLDNAIRHSIDHGLVRLEIQQEGGHALISVSDQGPGIPRELRERVFERFSRQDPARRRGGAGLGLAICREIVHAHDGRISIADHPPPGATVRITLPVLVPLAVGRAGSRDSSQPARDADRLGSTHTA